MAESDPFKWPHYQGEIIILCVRWYLRYALSYRDLEEMIQDRGLSLDHTTIYRWVQAYAPELEKRIRPHLRLTNDSYRRTHNSDPRRCRDGRDITTKTLPTCQFPAGILSRRQARIHTDAFTTMDVQKK